MKKDLMNLPVCTKKKSKNLQRSLDVQDFQKNTKQLEKESSNKLKESKAELISRLESELSVAKIENNKQKALSISKMIALFKNR